MLNWLAVFFILSLDNYLVTKTQVDLARDDLQASLESSILDPALPVVVPCRGFLYPLKIAMIIIPFYSFLVGLCSVFGRKGWLGLRY